MPAFLSYGVSIMNRPERRMKKHADPRRPSPLRFQNELETIQREDVAERGCVAILINGNNED
jgi:hypothetical protein